MSVVTTSMYCCSTPTSGICVIWTLYLTESTPFWFHDFGVLGDICVPGIYNGVSRTAAAAVLLPRTFSEG